MRIFFDTEFTELGVDPRLISIGFVDETGERTFYAELSDTYKERECSDFVREIVLPQLEGGVACMTWYALGKRLTAWLEAFGEPVVLVTESLGWDWPWIDKIFYERAWPANVDEHPLLLSMNYLVDFDQFEPAVEKAFTGGLRRHHSLDDAKANRLGWIAAGRDYNWERPSFAAALMQMPDVGEDSDWRIDMTMPYERSRAVLGAAEVLKELLNPQKHPETTEETRRHIRWALRHYPDRHEIDGIALLCPEYFARVEVVVNAKADDGNG